METQMETRGRQTRMTSLPLCPHGRMGRWGLQTDCRRLQPQLRAWRAANLIFFGRARVLDAGDDV